MLAKSKKKIAYWVFAAAAVVMLLGAPTVTPSAFADCGNSSSGNCGG
ncbi:MAG: hypothetical protein R6X32_15785 [Chloroflexota bacterium]|jgi:hypothetical protein